MVESDMNLSMDVLRWLSVKAIRGRTWAGMRVYDSPGEPADLRMEKERAPFVAVYTDDADFPLEQSPGVSIESLYDSGGTVRLVIEVAVAGQLEDAPERSQEQEDAEEKADHDPTDPDIDRPTKDRDTLAATDQGLEARIGFIARQVLDALTATDNPWAELWRIMAHERKMVEIRRGGNGQNKEGQTAQRYASRIMVLSIGVLGEPAPGCDLPPNGFWFKFLALADADPELSGVAMIVRDHITTDETLPWRIAQRAGTLTNEAVRGIGIGPALATMDETPVLQSVELTRE
jgi:hypothetical protein